MIFPYLAGDLSSLYEHSANCRPDVFLQYYPEMYGGRRGSLAPWRMRLIIAQEWILILYNLLVQFQIIYFAIPYFKLTKCDPILLILCHNIVTLQSKCFNWGHRLVKSLYIYLNHKVDKKKHK